MKNHETLLTTNLSPQIKYLILKEGNISYSQTIKLPILKPFLYIIHLYVHINILCMYSNQQNHDIKSIKKKCPAPFCYGSKKPLKPVYELDL